MIVWGGENSSGEQPTDFRFDGARYDPGTDSWNSMSIDGAPEGRSSHTAVWTGDEMIVFADAAFPPRGDGGRYDPDTDSWSPLSERELPDQTVYRYAAVWTGNEMVVWGGAENINSGHDAARYDPETDTWRLLATEGAPTNRLSAAVLWTGSEVIVWGGTTPDDLKQRSLRDGARYDPASDTWTEMSMAGAPEPTGPAVWTGTEMIVWGTSADSRASYDPVSDTWTPISISGVPDDTSQMAVWSDAEMIVWGDRLSSAGGRYDPARESWSDLSLDGAPAPRFGHQGVWTGCEMIVWGGEINDEEEGTREVDDGARWQP